MNENPPPHKWQRSIENYFQTYSGLTAGSVLLLGFLLRIWKASGTFLNLDEAMHVLTAIRPSLAEAYQASHSLAHPPLLVLLLNVWRGLGTSELVLRLPSVIAGTIFCWVFFRWLTRLLGPTAGWVGLVLVSFLPPFVELSAEVRQYALLLCFLISAAYILELALAEKSAGKILFFFVFLYLAMLTHFSALLFAGAVGVYSLWRLVSARSPQRVIAMWIAGQAGALGLFVFLYQTQISSLKSSGAFARHVQVFLANSYFHWGRDHLLPFIFARTFGVLQYAFGQHAVGDIGGVLFIAGVVLLLKGKEVPEQGPSRRQLGVYLMLPFAINCAAAIAGLYPYGGTRHSAFLLPFAVACVSLALTRLTRKRLGLALAACMVTVAVCYGLGVPHRPYMRREDQRYSNMVRAIDAIRQKVSPADTIFVDFQTNFLLTFYLCPDSASELLFSDSAFRESSCSGYRVISTGSQTNILTAGKFPSEWNEMVSTYNFKPGQTIWIFQAGWDIGLARELQEKLAELHDLKTDSFGRNISLFKLTVGQPMGSPVARNVIPCAVVRARGEGGRREMP